MFKITFNPGPSQVSAAVKADMAEAVNRNIASISHRSSEFVKITEQAVKGLRQYFDVPPGYHVLLTSSATEALELTIRNLVSRESFHFTNGHFSELFAKVSRSFGNKVGTDSVEWGRQNGHEAADIPASSEIVTLTYNETSTGVTCSNETVKRLRERFKDQLLVVDITSVAGCLPLEIADADVWLFSVQKGLGLPSGLGVMFVSPQALERSRQLQNKGLYNFEHMSDRMSEYQTIHTPNVLGIYLLDKQLARWNDPVAISNYDETAAKARLVRKFVETHHKINYFVEPEADRSMTTICLKAKPTVINDLHQAAADAELVIGAGYGKLKSETCRIATFPALSQADIKLLLKTLGAAI